MPRTNARFARRLAGAALALLSALPGPAAAQGVIAPPSEGQPIAPQPPTATTIDPAAPGVPPQAGSAQPRMVGPASVADLADRLLGAVVNISTSQNVEGGPARPTPPQLNAPDGSPL